MAQVAPPDDDDDHFVEESVQRDCTVWRMLVRQHNEESEPDVLAFFMNADNSLGSNRSQSAWRATIQTLSIA